MITWKSEQKDFPSFSSKCGIWFKLQDCVWTVFPLKPHVRIFLRVKLSNWYSHSENQTARDCSPPCLTGSQKWRSTDANRLYQTKDPPSAQIDKSSPTTHPHPLHLRKRRGGEFISLLMRHACASGLQAASWWTCDDPCGVVVWSPCNHWRPYAVSQST